MVDAVVSFVVGRLGDYIIQEARFLREVKDDVLLLKNELEWMQCFIMDAEQKQVENALIRKWVSDIRDIAYDTEDVLDSYLLKWGRRETPNQNRGFLASISKYCCRFNLYGIGKKIETLKKRINDLKRKREFYRLEDIGNKGERTSNDLGKLKELRRVTSFVVEENVIGFEDDAKVLLGKLVEDEPRRFVISIYGMGGLGKTTLAKKLYHNSAVVNKFHRRAWVSVSQDYKTEDLLRRIIKSFRISYSTIELEKMNTEDLERHLHGSLLEHSYLVVIDDVWQKEAWESLKRSFPDSNNGSRVIITTRIKEVAERSDERTHVHKLRFLSQDESWKLFSGKAFRNFTRDEGLEELGREMVQKCGGLPLAIVVLSGLLSTKKPQEWHLVRDQIWRHLRNDSIHVSYLLDLSFSNLSYQLKLCFLYLSIYPEDYEISVAELIRLLVAEGFIKQEEDQVMEDVAKNHLDELINRSLIQIERIHHGIVEACRVHDLLRDLAIEKAKELNFVYNYIEIAHSNGFSTSSSCRRLSCKNLPLLFNRLSNMRSIFLFSGGFDFLVGANCRDFRLLRVLYIHCYGSTLIDYSCFLEEMTKLIHLKYLSIRNASITCLPPSISHLQSLQTLDFYSHSSVKLPTELSKLQDLRHLIGFLGDPLPIENLTNLQTLKFVSYQTWAKVNPEKLINLRDLHIYYYSEKDENEFSFDSIAKLKSIRVLRVKLFNQVCFGSLEPLYHCPSLLQLRLDGKMKRLPRDMHEVVPNLECLCLNNTGLEDDPMPKLGKLRSLVFLELLYKSYGGKKMVCTSKGFPRLENLEIDLDGLEELQVEEGAMKMLKSVQISRAMSSNLRIPERLRSVSVTTSSCHYGFIL
ncbi:disease resistance protein RPP13-like [Mangifera indica]|uniref:disease resistance protein RPP13-like n=1 Tax=Mangifera indica TaxID=29780 RepID=UPI001CF95ED8|nr:disease resistance protein RPP13-like [Mangifera indica]